MSPPAPRPNRRSAGSNNCPETAASDVSAGNAGEDALRAAVDKAKFEVLLVEDNDAHAELISICMHAESELPLRIERVGDGEAALRYVYDSDLRSPDLVLLDLRMPKLDGLQVLQRLKGDPETRSIPVVVMTTSQREEDVREAYKAHANSYLVKPMDFERMKTIARSLAQYWLRTNTFAPQDSSHG